MRTDFTRKGLAAAALLAGCTSDGYWQPNPAWHGFRPAQIAVVEIDDPSAHCGGAPRSLLGCAVRQREQNHCTVYVRSQLPYPAFACVVTHETRHCVGDDHLRANDRPHYAVDCGTGEMYSGPVGS
jgi:hypothetical protein